MIRAALVALKPQESQPGFVESAADLAAQYGWELVGVSVIDADRLAPAEAVPLGASAAKVHRDRERIAVARQAAIQVTSVLEKACREQSVRCTVHVRDGDVVQVLAAETPATDVLICGHTAGRDTSQQSLLHSILKQNVRPALVIPASKSPGSAVLVAYDGSAQAARALASFAVSGLADKRAVHVISVHQDLSEAAALARCAATFLERHGISAEPHGMQLTRDIAQQILDEASRISAGLIVLGAFGKSIVSEFFFGSVTRSILSSLPVPVFMDH